jgi:glycosyltransferase involved in cell wall biosynthesis
MVAYSFYESDNRVMRYAEALAQRGDHVDAIALRRKGDKEKEILNGVTVYRIQERELNETGKLDYLLRLLKFLFASAWLLTKNHLSKRYALIHVHSVPDFEVFSAIIPKLLGAKVILDIHDIVPEFFASKFSNGNQTLLFKALQAVEKLSCAFSDHVIISNHLWEKKLTERSVSPSKCTTIINFPDQNIFYKREGLQKGKSFTIMYPGTLNWHQGLDIGIRAVAKIRDSIQGLKFLIFGDGPTRGALIELVKQLGLEDIVVFRDPLPLREIAEEMAHADIGIIPKRNDSFGGEAFSTKTLEFMSLGVPIVLSKTRIDSHYFDDSMVKFFEPENEDELAYAVLLLAKDKRLRDRLAENGLRYALANSWNHKKELYLNLVSSLINHH